MPDVVTHGKFALDVLERLPKEVRDIATYHKKLILLGAQGPDVFFYNKFLPWQNSIDSIQIAKSLHDEKTNLFFNTFLRELSISKDKTFDADFSFLIGLIMHYSLDTVTHPYVFFLTALYDKNDPSTHNYKSNHLKFERAIDSVFIKEHWNASPHRFKIYKEILGVKRIPASVRAILNISLYKVYNVSEGSYKYESSFKDMKSYFKYFARDKFGLKRKLLRFIDRRFGKDSTIIFETLSYYKNIEEIDYFNEQRKEWTHPCYPEEKSSETFFELYEKAITRAVDLITKTYDFFTDENITTVDYGNLSYSTGKDCTDKTPMQYFNSIY